MRKAPMFTSPIKWWAMPPRTSALMLYGTFARLVQAPDYPIGVPAELFAQFLELVEKSWGTGSMSADYFAPSLARDEAFRRSWARFERLAVSPSGIKALLRITQETDARPALPVIPVPTLILHREGRNNGKRGPRISFL